MKISEEIYSVWGRGLGDCWSSINVYLKYSIQRNCVIRVATWYPKGDKRRDVKSKVTEIVPLFDCSGQILLTDERPTHRCLSKEPSTMQYYPTKVQWEDNGSRQVCYQFDGKSHGTKNFSSIDEAKAVLDFLINMRYTVVRLGSHLLLSECVNIMAHSAFFVGVESGMFHISHSVGVPRYVIRNGFSEETVRGLHGDKKYTIFANGTDFMNAISGGINESAADLRS